METLRGRVGHRNAYANLADLLADVKIAPPTSPRLPGSTTRRAWEDRRWTVAATPESAVRGLAITCVSTGPARLKPTPFYRAAGAHYPAGKSGAAAAGGRSWPSRSSAMQNRDDEARRSFEQALETFRNRASRLGRSGLLRPHGAHAGALRRRRACRGHARERPRNLRAHRCGHFVAPARFAIGTVDWPHATAISHRCVLGLRCPWCYIGHRRIQQLQREFEVDVEWRPFELFHPETPTDRRQP